MKLFIFAFTISFSLLLVSCDKSSNDPVTPINCNGLVTDTAGTGDNGQVFMPTAFTPNGDGKNDVIRPICSNIAAIEFTIYDQHNGVVFMTTTIGQGWNTTVSAGTFSKYYYRIQATTMSNHKIGKCGELYKLSCYPQSIPQSNFTFEDQLTPSGFTGVTSEVLVSCP